MLEIGKFNTLTINRRSPHGLYLLDEESHEEVLLPNSLIPPDFPDEGEECEAFIFTDSEDRLTATCQRPTLERNQFAFLKVFAVSEYGAFLEWGMAKHLLCPFAQQQTEMKEGYHYMIHMYLDDLSRRLVASSRIHGFLDHGEVEYEIGEEVDIMVWVPTPMGYKVIIEHRYEGLVYANEVFRDLQPGEHLQAYIKGIREDNKIDISLQPIGFLAANEKNTLDILDMLKASGGFLEVHDKSAPEEIKEVVGMSKKAFKKAVGGLYKKKRIELLPNGIKLKEAKE